MYAFVPYAIILVIGLLLLGPGVLRPWYRALRTGNHVSIPRIVRMRFRKLDQNAIVDAYIMAGTADMNINLDDIEAHAASGGRVQRTVLAAVAAHRAGLDYDHRMAIAADMSGRDAVAEVNDLIAAQRAKATELHPEPNAESLVGASGTASSPLGAPGIVRINGRNVSAVAKDGPIPKGTKVRVVQTRGGIAVVESIRHTEKG